MSLLHSVLSRLAVKGIPFLYKSKVHQGINCPIALESSLHAITFKKAREYMFGYLEDHMAGQTWREQKDYSEYVKQKCNVMSELLFA